MTSNSRKRKSGLSTQLRSYIQEMNLNCEDQLDIVIFVAQAIKFP